MDEPMTFEEWEKMVRGFLPWPDVGEVFEAIVKAEGDRADERLKLLKELLEGHYSASSMGVFNDE